MPSGTWENKIQITYPGSGFLMSMVCLIPCASSGLCYLCVVLSATWNVN